MVYRYAVALDQPAEARRIVRSNLADADGALVETAELLTSELVTNAIVYGVGEPTLVIEVDDHGIRVEVYDTNPNMDDVQPLALNPLDVHGRGLAIVDALASAWGVEPRRSGKAVWFRLDL